MSILYYYTGVGSRETPPEHLELFTRVATYLSGIGGILRSGGADGADLAFENGTARKQIFLPWKGFNNNSSEFYTPSPESFALASTVHPAWERCSEAVKKLHARNTQQVLGPVLNTPSAFLICYTTGGQPIGGTATAIRLAQQHNIPVFNTGAYGTTVTTQLRKDLLKFIHDSLNRLEFGE